MPKNRENAQILVVTPTMGKRDSIKRTIDSVRKYGGEMVRHVLVCPRDKREKLAAPYRMECIGEPEGAKGIYPALNYAFKKQGMGYRYITFINDDDYWLPAYTQLIREALDSDSQLVYGRICCEKDGKRVDVACSGRFCDFAVLLHRGIVLSSQQATLVRPAVFFEVGGFDEHYRLVSDTKLWAQLCVKNVTYHFVDRPCAVYTCQPGQLSEDGILQLQEHRDMLRALPSFSRWVVWRAVARFRFGNLPVYFRRWLVHHS